MSCPWWCAQERTKIFARIEEAERRNIYEIWKWKNNEGRSEGRMSFVQWIWLTISIITFFILIHAVSLLALSRTLTQSGSWSCRAAFPKASTIKGDIAEKRDQLHYALSFSALKSAPHLSESLDRIFLEALNVEDSSRANLFDVGLKP